MITGNIQIFYVADQERSAKFYRNVLLIEPVIDAPGMTEFALGPSAAFGLMPERGIKRLLGELLPDPASGTGIPRAELYLRVDDPAAYHNRAMANGASELSGLLQRDWGDLAAYSLDPDGHVLAFAKPITI